MKFASIYTDAAQYIFDTMGLYSHKGGCEAIAVATTAYTNYRNYAPERVFALKAFAEVFRPEWKPVYWFGRIFGKGKNKKRAMHRVHALLLMAAMAEEQGL
jgi:hypothetical protein